MACRKQIKLNLFHDNELWQDLNPGLSPMLRFLGTDLRYDLECRMLVDPEPSPWSVAGGQVLLWIRFGGDFES